MIGWLSSAVIYEFWTLCDNTYECVLLKQMAWSAESFAVTVLWALWNNTMTVAMVTPLKAVHYDRLL